MDLWILSQKKDQLVKTNVVRYSCFKDKLTNDELHIITNNEYDFGIYKTRERALEVIDEVQTLLLGDVLFKNSNIDSENLSQICSQLKIKMLGTVDANTRDCVVYEMPLETIYKCDLCGCKFEIEPDDLSVESMRTHTIDGQYKDTIIGLYVDCPYCGNEITIQRKMKPNGEQSK